MKTQSVSAFSVMLFIAFGLSSISVTKADAAVQKNERAQSTSLNVYPCARTRLVDAWKFGSEFRYAFIIDNVCDGLVTTITDLKGNPLMIVVSKGDFGSVYTWDGKTWNANSGNQIVFDPVGWMMYFNHSVPDKHRRRLSNMLAALPSK